MTKITDQPHEVDPLAAAELRIRRVREEAERLAASAPHRTEGVRLRYRTLMTEYLAMHADGAGGHYHPATWEVSQMVTDLGIEAAAILDAELSSEWWPNS